MSGIAMQLLGTSRCASGAEHHISHFIEMQPQGAGVSSDALHGEKVGVGTLLVSREYHRLKSAGLPDNDYKKASAEYIMKVFGQKLSDAVIKENEKDVAFGITASQLKENEQGIFDIIDEIPDAD